MGEMGRVLIVAGIVLIAAGAIFLLLSRTGIPLGRLPGDIVYKGKNTAIYFPLATCILLSVVVSVVLYLVGKLRH